MDTYKSMSTYTGYTYKYMSSNICYTIINILCYIQIFVYLYNITLTIICVFIYITLTSINLLPSLINSISLRLINIRNNLALSGSVP